jgi:Flp pilus assembly protein TadG
MVAPLLIFLLFGIIEFGLMVKDLVGINQAAREGVRCAAVGATPTTISARIDASAPTIDTSQLTKLHEYRSYDQDYGTWSSWTVLGVEDDENNAQQGDQIRITIAYPHQLVTGGVFAYLADDPEQGTISLETAIIMRRE